MTGLVSTTFTREEEDDGPGPPVRTWVVDVAGGDWDESCRGCGGCPGAAATPAAPHPRLDPAEPDPEEEEGFPLEREEEDDLLDFPGIAEGKSATSPSSSEKGEVRNPESGENRRGGANRPPGRLGHWMASWGV